MGTTALEYPHRVVYLGRRQKFTEVTVTFGYYTLIGKTVQETSASISASRSRYSLFDDSSFTHNQRDTRRLCLPVDIGSYVDGCVSVEKRICYFNLYHKLIIAGYLYTMERKVPNTFIVGHSWIRRMETRFHYILRHHAPIDLLYSFFLRGDYHTLFVVGEHKR